MTVNTLNLSVKQGATFPRVVRWETAPLIYKAISAIAKVAPVRITATAHEIPPGWRAYVQSVVGMRDINAQNSPPKDSDFHKVTVVDANIVEFNDTDASAYPAYKSGGYLVYNTPVPLTDYTARMSVKDRIGGTELLRLDTDNGRIVIDEDDFTITLTIDAEDTAEITWTNAVYSLEMVSPDGVVTPLLEGKFTVKPDATSD